MRPGAVGNAVNRSIQAAVQQLGRLVYSFGGRIPHTPGYEAYRDRYIERIIENEELLQVFAEGHELPGDFGTRLDERVVEYPWVCSRLRRFKQKMCFLDAGSSFNHEMILRHPSVKRHKWTLLTLAPEPECFWDLGVSYLYDDLRRIPCRNEWFDAVFCISVIEHVGMDNGRFVADELYRERKPHDYLRAVEEMRRVIKPGGWLFLSVPFGRYENHGWLQQFDSALLSTLISRFQPQEVNKTFFRYTPRGWRLATEDQCRDLAYFDVRASDNTRSRGVGRAEPDFAAAARGVACVELQKL